MDQKSQPQYSPVAAAAAQVEFCDAHGAPLFAPEDGVCPLCGWNIYMPDSVGESGCRGGVTLQEAGSRLITGCPHCHGSYVD